MTYIDKIFMRADIQQIRAFLLHGVEGSVDPRSYKERIETVEERVIARLCEDYPNPREYEEITSLVFDYAGTIEAVYLEIGLQLGVILSAQAWQNLKMGDSEDE